ncbi:unnamed protein product [Meganyctiphanes norvegica]|uniref:Uncharacterized protein n=1 Tax=Meganyctiphanes norvegica TaxID=48144 RepID=A0AAV2QTG2_MEGNR
MPKASCVFTQHNCSEVANAELHPSNPCQCYCSGFWPAECVYWGIPDYRQQCHCSSNRADIASPNEGCTDYRSRVIPLIPSWVFATGFITAVVLGFLIFCVVCFCVIRTAWIKYKTRLLLTRPKPCNLEWLESSPSEEDRRSRVSMPDDSCIFQENKGIESSKSFSEAVHHVSSASTHVGRQYRLIPRDSVGPTMTINPPPYPASNPPSYRSTPPPYPDNPPPYNEICHEFTREPVALPRRVSLEADVHL